MAQGDSSDGFVGLDVELGWMEAPTDAAAEPSTPAEKGDGLRFTGKVLLGVAAVEAALVTAAAVVVKGGEASVYAFGYAGAAILALCGFWSVLDSRRKNQSAPSLE